MTTLKAANRIEQEAERRSRKCRPIVTCMEQVPVLTVHASRKRTPPIQRQLGGGGSGMLVKAECQQEVEAAHPAPAWGRWKRNASRKRKGEAGSAVRL